MRSLVPLLFACSSVAFSQDWDRFRGPAGAGVALDFTWPEELSLEKAAWRVELPGRGHSSPAVRGGRAYLTCADAEAQLRRVVALDVATGKSAWTFEAPLETYGHHRLNSFAASTPVVDDERVYVAWTNGTRLIALAVDLAGEEVWTRDLGVFAAQHGSGASPVLAGGHLVVVQDCEGEPSRIVGLDPKTGEQRWERARTTSRAAYGTPTVLGELLLFSSTSHGVFALDPTNGEVAWESEQLFRARCVGSPVVAGGLVFATAGQGGGGTESAAVRIPTGESPCTVAYKLGRSLPYVPTPVYHAGRLYLWSDGGVVSCVSANDGEELWRDRAGGNFFSSPVLLGDRLCAISMSGELCVLAAGDTFEVQARLDLGEASEATPAVAGNRLLLRTETHLTCLGGD